MCVSGVRCCKYASSLRDRLSLPGLYLLGNFPQPLVTLISFFSLLALPSLSVANLLQVPACMQTQLSFTDKGFIEKQPTGLNI